MCHRVGLVRFVEGSVLDAGLLDELMAEADACFHLAATVGVQLVVDRPLNTLLGNVRGVDVVMGAAVRHGRRLLFTSASSRQSREDYWQPEYSALGALDLLVQASGLRGHRLPVNDP